MKTERKKEPTNYLGCNSMDTNIVLTTETRSEMIFQSTNSLVKVGSFSNIIHPYCIHHVKMTIKTERKNHAELILKTSCNSKDNNMVEKYIFRPNNKSDLSKSYPSNLVMFQIFFTPILLIMSQIKFMYLFYKCTDKQETKGSFICRKQFFILHFPFLRKLHFSFSMKNKEKHGNKFTHQSQKTIVW